MVIYFSQDGGFIEYSHDKAHLTDENAVGGDYWRAKFKVGDFDTDAAIWALNDWKTDMHATFGADLQFVGIDCNGGEFAS